MTVGAAPSQRGGDSFSLGAALIASAREHPDRPALWCKSKTYTYAELFGHANSIASAILSHVELSASSRVAILSERTFTAYSGIAAALLAGAGYVPLNPRFPMSRNREILEDSGASVLICDEKHRAQLKELTSASEVELILLPESAAENDAVRLSQIVAEQLPRTGLQEFCVAEHRVGELAYLFFTSGSTGKPKGVPITHSNVFAYLEGIKSFCRFGPDDRVLQIVDLSFDLSVHDMFLTWLAGAQLFSVPENSVLLTTRLVQEFDITAWLSVPSTAAWLQQAGVLQPGSLPSMRHSFFCGEALASSVAEAWQAAAPTSDVYNIYGPTEATVAFTWHRYVRGRAQPSAVVPLGRPLPSQHVGLFSGLGVPATEATGEICLAGSQVTTGYWRAPSLTQERFFEYEGKRWYRTGDLGRFDGNGDLHYLGRTDHQVKIRGYRVELQEIEHAIRAITGAPLVAVIAWAPEGKAAAMGCAAFVVGSSMPEADVLASARDRLPEYMVPSCIISMTALPFNVNGKVDHGALKSHPRFKELG